jgi:chromosome segregation ATPase
MMAEQSNISLLQQTNDELTKQKEKYNCLLASLETRDGCCDAYRVFLFIFVDILQASIEKLNEKLYNMSMSEQATASAMRTASEELNNEKFKLACLASQLESSELCRDAYRVFHPFVLLALLRAPLRN